MLHCPRMASLASHATVPQPRRRCSRLNMIYDTLVQWVGVATRFALRGNRKKDKDLSGAHLPLYPALRGNGHCGGWKTLVREPRCRLQTAFFGQSGTKTFGQWCEENMKEPLKQGHTSINQRYISFREDYPRMQRECLITFHIQPFNTEGWKQLLLVLLSTLTVGRLRVTW